MRLKRLDIVGFKSFMDKTVVQFDEGVTGVVGPNGCGKSNIVDAIRWVLGEQSPKHLRGGSMSDVIFNGSQTRPPLGMAEVTLTVTNDRPEEVPARYRELSEIAIGRRLFRTGESEYLINKTPCRLLDITELFLGTGVGTKAYSIIEQGRIGLIVSAKPDDRRSLIEEAAGITRFKAKKRAAERKMDHTRANLLRVGDVVSEIGRNLDSLKRQARKAERYKKLKGQLEEIELHIASHRWLEIRALGQVVDLGRKRLREDLVDHDRRIEQGSAALREARTALAAEEARLAGLQEKAAAAEGQAEVHRERVSGHERERESIDLRTREAQTELRALEVRLESLAEERAQTEERLSELQTVLEADQGQLDARVEEQNRVQAALTRLVDEREGHRAGALDAIRTVTQGKSHLEALAKQQRDIEEREARATAERDALKVRLAELRAHHEVMTGQLDETRQLHLKLEQEREAQEIELSQCRERLVDLRSIIAERRDDLSDRRGRQSSLLEIQRNFEGYQQGVRSVMLHREEIDGVDPAEIEGILADVLTVAPGREVALERVLGEALQYVLVRSRETGIRLIEWLREGATGWSSFVPMDALRSSGADAAARFSDRPGVVSTAMDAVTVDPAHADVVRHLLGNVVIVEDAATAFGLWGESDGLVSFVTLDGLVLSPEGILFGGEGEGAGAHLLEMRREIADLGTAIRQMEQQLERDHAEHERLESRQRALESALENLSRDSHSEQINIVSQEKELHRLSDEINRSGDRLAVLTHEHEQHQQTLSEVNAERRRTLEAIQGSDAEQSRHEDAVSELSARIDETGERLANLQAEVTALRVKAAGDAERHEAVAKEISRMERDRSDARARVEQLETVVAGSGDAFSSLEARIESDREAAVRLDAEAVALREELAAGRQRVTAETDRLTAEEERVESMRAERETLAEESSELGLQGRELEVELRHLESMVRDRYGIPMIAAVHQWHTHPVPDEGDSERLEVLREKVERMGEVNLTAITEYEELSQRHTFLTEQKADLERSLEQLHKAILKINRTSRQRFLETFEAVDTRFRKVFPRLFQGGKAGLELTDPSNPLESGVEIFAQPPGKKLQSVSLLSGGEKALTAVSLLFAIFLVRPTPFCLLDEVDAPLDDHNVGRYNQIVREMAQRSQFILITHNKLTMEISDSLYGVTMEEPGISKLVSVRLNAEGAARAPATGAAA